MNEQTKPTTTETKPDHWRGDDFRKALELLDVLMLPFVPLEPPEIARHDCEGICTMIRTIKEAIDSAAEEFERLVGRPYAAAVKDTAAEAYEKYCDGYRQGRAAERAGMAVPQWALHGADRDG